MNDSNVRERVLKGAAWLDFYDPKWATHIRVNDLDLMDDCTCVLGQYATKVNAKSFWSFICDESIEVAAPFQCTFAEARAMGFDVHDVTNPSMAEYEALKYEWTIQIKERVGG